MLPKGGILSQKMVRVRGLRERRCLVEGVASRKQSGFIYIKSWHNGKDKKASIVGDKREKRRESRYVKMYITVTVMERPNKGQPGVRSNAGNKGCDTRSVHRSPLLPERSAKVPKMQALVDNVSYVTSTNLLA